MQPFLGHLQLQPVSEVGDYKAPRAQLSLDHYRWTWPHRNLNRKWAAVSVGSASVGGGLAELGQPSPQVPLPQEAPKEDWPQGT